MELDFSKNINDASGLKGLLAAETAKNEVNLLPDSEFAYIEEGGNADSFNRTVPLTLRHFPIASEGQIISSLEALEASNLSEELKFDILDRIEAKAKKMNVKLDKDNAMMKKRYAMKMEKEKAMKMKEEKAKMGETGCAEKSEAELTEKQKKLPPAIQKSILEKQKKSGKSDKGEDSKEEPKEKSDAMKMEEDDAMMKKMYSRMDEIEKARKDMDKEYAMIKDKLGAMMKKVKASSSEDE
jgi:hypothetical protein